MTPAASPGWRGSCTGRAGGSCCLHGAMASPGSPSTQHRPSSLSTLPFVPLLSFIPAGSHLGLAEPLCQRGWSGSGSSWSCWRAGTGTPEPLPNLPPFPNWANPLFFCLPECISGPVPTAASLLGTLVPLKPGFCC